MIRSFIKIAKRVLRVSGQAVAGWSFVKRLVHSGTVSKGGVSERSERNKGTCLFAVRRPASGPRNESSGRKGAAPPATTINSGPFGPGIWSGNVASFRKRKFHISGHNPFSRFPLILFQQPRQPERLSTRPAGLILWSVAITSNGPWNDRNATLEEEELVAL